MVVLLSLVTVCLSLFPLKAEQLAKAQDYKSTEEYRNLIAIIKAYRDGNAGQADNLQTPIGKDVAAYIAGMQWLSKLKAPAIVNYKLLGTESELHFAFEFPGSSKAVRVVVKFWLFNGKRCLNDIYFPDPPFPQGLVSGWVWHRDPFPTPPFVESLKLLANQAQQVASGTTKFDDMSRALSEFQSTAAMLGYAEEPEVTNFVSAAIDAIAFATTWQQVTKAAYAANMESEWKKSISTEIELKLTQLATSMDASGRASLDESIKKAMSDSCEQTINALSVEQSRQFIGYSKRLRAAYQSVLKLTELHAGFKSK